MPRPNITEMKGPGSWGVYINGKLWVNGLTKREVPYHKKVALEVWEKDQARQLALALALGPKRKPRMPKPWAPRRLRWQPPRPK